MAELLYLRGEACTFTLFSVTCLLDEGRRCEVIDAGKLHVKLLSFTWDHEIKVLKDGIFTSILGMDFLDRIEDVGGCRFEEV